MSTFLCCDPRVTSADLCTTYLPIYYLSTFRISFISLLLIFHSAMGKSRSATVCIAYLLHQQRSVLTPQSALALIRESRPLCEPNPGFMEQLNVYHQMGCPEDVTSHTLYSRWLYHREVEESVACGRAPEMQSVLFEDEQPQQRIDSDGQNAEIKCRRCRSVTYSNPQTESMYSPHIGVSWRSHPSLSLMGLMETLKVQ